MTQGLWVGGEPVVVITGATRGIGLAAAGSLASSGANVVMVVRDPTAARAACARIDDAHGRACTDVVECDLASFASVREAAAVICRRHPAVDAVVCNAGIISSTRELSEDGHELTFQVNHLSHFLLVHLLRPALMSSAPARVVTVSSEAHRAAWRGIDFEDIEAVRGFTPFRAYAATKLMNVMFAFELGARWSGSGVAANSMHPGLVSSEWGTGEWGLWGRVWNSVVPKITPEQGADTLTYLALSPEVEGVTARYFVDRAPRKASRRAYDTVARNRLWELSERLTGLAEPANG